MTALRHRWAVSALMLAALSANPAGVLAQSRSLTLDDIYDPATRVNFGGNPVPAMTWIDDVRYLVAQRDGEGVVWTEVNARDGRTAPLFDAAAFQKAVSALSGVSPEEARAQSRSRALTFSGDHSAALMTKRSTLWAPCGH